MEEATDRVEAMLVVVAARRARVGRHADARRRAAPLKGSGIQIGAPASCSPFTPAARTMTATIVPQTLNRPPRNWVEPRKAELKAGSR